MSFVLNIPSTFKTSTIPSIFGDNVLTGNQTLNGDLKVSQSMTLGSGIMSDSSYESMEITQTLRVDEHSIFNSAIVEQSMNVVSSSQFNSVIASNMELTNLNVGSKSKLVAITRDENIDINSLYTQDISFSNIYVLLYNLSLSDISLSDILSLNNHVVLIDDDEDENSYTYISLYDLSLSNYSITTNLIYTFTLELVEISHLLSNSLSQDISLSTLEVTNIDICGHLQVPDISFSNIEVEKLMLSDLSVNNATIANLSVNSVELETTSLYNRFSILFNEVSQVFSGQSSVLYAFMAKGSTNHSISSGTTIPFVTTNNTFDTIVLRRPSGNSGSTYHINLRELQMWVDNSNVLPSSAGSGNNTENRPYDEISNNTTFMDWSTKKSTTHWDVSTDNQASNIYNNDINGIYSFDVTSNDNDSNIALYIPLTTQYNINNIQTFVLYNRADIYKTRAEGLAIELYNRKNDPNLSVVLSYSDEISSHDLVYRFDFPSLYTYPDASFESHDSISQIRNNYTTQVTTYINNNIGRYTIHGSSSGIWHFGVHGHCINTSTTDLRLGIFRNDELIIQSQITQQNIHIHSIFECETNDVIQVKCTMGTGYIDLSNSCFFGYRYNPSNNNIQQNTHVLVNSLDMSHNENVTIEQGHLLLKQGDILMTSGGINSQGSIYTNGQVVITSQYTDDNKYFMKYNIDDSNHWDIYTDSNDDLYYSYNTSARGYISSSSMNGSGQMNFTGQHRCFIKDPPTISNEHIGLIVCANQNMYISMIEPRQSIHQNEALPYVSLCKKNNDKSCFGVISASEDPNKRVDKYGSFASLFPKEKGDTRIYINSVGEGALWVINKNGTLESGDYITTTDISGYGMKQNSDNVKNYSVAKITMDCDFNPLMVPKKVILKDSNGENILNAHNQIQWTNQVDASGNIVYEYQYKIKYINQHANEISQQEYIDQSNNAYIASYVGCTYHCG